MSGKSPLQKFLNKQSLHLVMYGHVQALRLNALSFSVEGAILNFQNKYKISEDQFPMKSAVVAFYRMDKEWNEHLKSDGNT